MASLARCYRDGTIRSPIMSIVYSARTFGPTSSYSQHQPVRSANQSGMCSTPPPAPEVSESGLCQALCPAFASGNTERKRRGATLHALRLIFPGHPLHSYPERCALLNNGIDRQCGQSCRRAYISAHRRHYRTEHPAPSNSPCFRASGGVR